ncbi:MAG: TolC family protein [Saccharospirillum sp.]
MNVSVLKRLAGVVVLVLPLFAVHGESGPVMAVSTYLETTLRQHVTQRAHQAQTAAEALSLSNGRRQLWPDVTARTDYGEDTTETASLPMRRTSRRGITTGVDTQWSAWLGTDVTLSLEHQYGRQLGQVTQGIPEDDLQVQNVNIEISQPLLKGTNPFFYRLPLLRAQADWDAHRVRGDLNRLTILREAMHNVLAVQEAHDRLQFEIDRLAHARTLAEATQALVQEGRSLRIDQDLAQLDVLRQEQAVSSAVATLDEHQRALTLEWRDSAHIQLQPMTSTVSLVEALLPVRDAALRPEEHPAYRQRQIQLTQAQRETRARARDHWPDVSAYYRFEKSFRESLPDDETQAWGLRFSYDLFDLSTRSQQARLSAETAIARWEVDEQRKQHQWEVDRLLQSTANYLAELDLHEQAMALSQRAVDHEFVRYREGVASYRDVQTRQQDLQERRSNALTTHVALARELIELGYYHQWDWFRRIP